MYSRWQAMVQQHRDHVCPQWLADPWAFYAHLEEMTPKPAGNYVLDRIDYQRDYEPGNLRWVSRRSSALLRKAAAATATLAWMVSCSSPSSPPATTPVTPPSVPVGSYAPCVPMSPIIDGTTFPAPPPPPPPTSVGPGTSGPGWSSVPSGCPGES